MASLKKHERLKRKAIILLEDNCSAEISERAIIQELLDSGASKPEAARVVEDLFEAGKVRRSTMGYLEIFAG